MSIVEQLSKARILDQTFASRQDVVTFFQGQKLGDYEAVLEELLNSSRHRTAGSLEILLAICQPELDSIIRARRRWDPDPEQLGQNVRVALILAASSARTRSRVDTPIINQLRNAVLTQLRAIYRPTWIHRRKEVQAAPDRTFLLEKPVLDTNLTVIDLGDTMLANLSRLERLLQSRKISKKQFRILFFTQILGQSPADFARKHDLDHEQIKKTCQRARKKYPWIVLAPR